MAQRISEGRRGRSAIKVTVPEGFDVAQISSLFREKLFSFNQEIFEESAAALEGYLFPDTYFFFNTDDEETVIIIMNENFKRKMKELSLRLAEFGKSEREGVTMGFLI